MITCAWYTRSQLRLLTMACESQSLAIIVEFFGTSSTWVPYGCFGLYWPISLPMLCIHLSLSLSNLHSITTVFNSLLNSHMA